MTGETEPMLATIPSNNFATEPRLNHTQDTNLAVFNQNNTSYSTLNQLDKYLTPNDVIVVNDSAVIPGTFQGFHVPSNQKVEFRLVRFLSSDKTHFSQWEAIVYGQGDWTTPTEKRLNPPLIVAGDKLITGDLIAEVQGCSIVNNRLLRINFLGSNPEILRKIYSYGSLIQYSYLSKKLQLWDHQTLFSCYPVSIEPSSSLFQLDWDLIFRIAQKGIKIIPITHAISISNTGISDLDQLLPLPERYWLSRESAQSLNQVKEEDKSIIAFGTSVTRSLEHIYGKYDYFKAGTEDVELVITKNHSLKVINGLLTGMHIVGESHVKLLQAFLPMSLITNIYNTAIQKGFLWHEYGDSMLIKKKIKL